VSKKCSRCGSGLVYDQVSPVDCLTYRYCDTCGLLKSLEVQPTEEDTQRARILDGLTLKVSSRYKRWGTR